MLGGWGPPSPTKAASKWWCLPRGVWRCFGGSGLARGSGACVESVRPHDPGSGSSALKCCWSWVNVIQGATSTSCWTKFMPLPFSNGAVARLLFLGCSPVGTSTAWAGYWRAEPVYHLRWEWSWATSWIAWVTAKRRLPWPNAGTASPEAGGVPPSTAWIRSQVTSDNQSPRIVVPSKVQQAGMCSVADRPYAADVGAHNRVWMSDLTDANLRRVGFRWESKWANPAPCIQRQCTLEMHCWCRAPIQLLWVHLWTCWA